MTVTDGVFIYNEVPFALSTIYVSAYNITTNTYGATVANIAAPQLVEVDADHDTDILQGAGKNQRMISVLKGMDLKLAAGGIDFDAMTIMTGGTETSSGSSPNRRRLFRVPAGGSGLPYFGMVCVGRTDDNGLIVAGMQCCKLKKTPKFTLDGKENKYNISEAEGYALPVTVGSAAYALTIRTYEAEGDFTVPTDAATFLAVFNPF